MSSLGASKRARQWSRIGFYLVVIGVLAVSKHFDRDPNAFADTDQVLPGVATPLFAVPLSEVKRLTSEMPVGR